MKAKAKPRKKRPPEPINLDGHWYEVQKRLWLEITGKVPESPNLSMGRHAHWSTASKIAQLWRARIQIAVAASNLPGRPPCDHKRVAVTVWQTRRRTLDPDNLVGSVKPVLDALRNCDAIKDDTAEYLTLEVLQKVRPKSEGPVVTEISVQYA